MTERRARQGKPVIIAAACAGMAAGMLGLAFAAVPLYDLFCRVTGFGGTTQVATEAAGTVLDRTVVVRFDSNVAKGLPLQFRPSERSTTVRIGDTGLAFYTVTNTSDAPITVVATYNVTPFKVGQYFQKLQCFCFEDFTIDAGASMELPVVFFVAPDLAEDTFADEVRTITLSYTFFDARDPNARNLAAGPQGDLGGTGGAG